jgi:hypothetical protein
MKSDFVGLEDGFNFIVSEANDFIRAPRGFHRGTAAISLNDTIFNTGHGRLGFAHKDGKIVVEGVGYDLKQHFFDIFLEKDGDETVTLFFKKACQNQKPITIN